MAEYRVMGGVRKERERREMKIWREKEKKRGGVVDAIGEEGGQEGDTREKKQGDGERGGREARKKCGKRWREEG